MIVKIDLHSDEYDNRPWCVFFENQGSSANIAILGDEPDTAYLFNVFSTNRQKGEASALIREIDEYCVANQITLIVDAIVYENGTDGIQNNDALKTWYEKNGAHFIGNTDEGSPILLLGYDSDQSE